MNVRNGIALLGLLTAACSTNNQRSDLVITKVIEATDDGTGCAFDATSDELVFSTLNPTSNLGEVAAVVENRLLDPSSTNPLLRTNSALFEPHQVVVDYEVLPRTAGAPPPYGPIPRQIVAAGGVVVPTGGLGTVAAPLFLPGVLPAAAATNDIIRVIFHVEGKLADGSTVRTNEREYLFKICTTCATTNACL
jgi:hypothetical protein